MQLIARALIALALLLSCSNGPADAQQKTLAPAAVPAQPSLPVTLEQALYLIRSTLLTLNDANRTGNYTVLRDLGSPNFQANSAAQLGDIFANQRKQALDFGAVAVLDPQLTLLPQIEPNGMLHMAGFFPSVPLQVNFELLFEPANRQWKIYGVSVNLSSGAPQAPDTPVVEQQKPDDAGPPPDAPSMAVQPKKAAKP